MGFTKLTYNLKKYEKEIRDRIGEKRFLHTLRVRDTAIELAKIHNVDLESAEVAGFLHDCAQIIHSYLGALYARELYGIEDEDILNAITYHTTGRANMSDLEKIIFLADYIEPMRNFDGVERARHLAKKDLDAAMYFALNNTLKFLVEHDTYIVPTTVIARNYYKELNP